MRTYEVKIKFTTPCLATWVRGSLLDERTDAVERFQRTDEGKLLFQPQWVFAAVTGSVSRGGRTLAGMNPTDFRLSTSFDAETDIFVTRSLARDGSGRDDNIEREAIMPDTQVVLTASTDDNVTPEKVDKIMYIMGKMVGLSPFGHAMGYGLFDVVEIVELDTDLSPEGTWSP